MTRDGCWLPWPSPTGAYILLRLRHARHCRPVRLHPRLPSTHNPPLLPGFLSLPLPPRVRKRVARLPIPPPRPPPPRAPLEPAPARPPRAVQGGGTTASNDAQPPPESVFLRKQQPASRSHHFRWKILGPLRGRPGLTLQRASVFNFSFPLFLFPTQEQE